MKSKKSFFNKTMFFKDIIRLWPLWVIGVIITQVAFTIPFFTNSIELTGYGSSEMGMNHLEILNQIRELMVDIIADSSEYLLFMAVMAVISAVLVFQYLNRQCSSYMLHSLPVSRKAMYLTHFLSGFIMYLLPFLLVWCVLGCLNVTFGIHMGAAMLGFVLETIMIAFFFYSLACFIVMISSSSIMTFIMYGVINCLVFVFYGVAKEVLHLFTYGSGSFESILFDVKPLVTLFTPVWYFLQVLGNQGVSYDEDGELLSAVDGMAIDAFHGGSVAVCAIYLIPALFFFILAYVLYRRRKLERVDENLVFPWSKVVYRFVFCFCGSYIFTWLMYYLTSAVFSHLVTYQYCFLIGVFYLLIGSVLCYLICDMVLEKTFFIWKRLSYMQMGIITLAAIMLFLVGRYTYIHQSIVDAKQVKECNITFNGAEFCITQPERIEELLALQKAVMEQGDKKLLYEQNSPESDASYTYEQSYVSMNFNYTLKDKGMLYREYNVLIVEQRLLSDMIQFLNNPEYLITSVLPEDFKKEYLEYMEYYEDDYGDAYTEYGDDFDEEGEGGEVVIMERESMYDALMKDMQEGHLLFGNVYKTTGHGLVDNGRRIGFLDCEYFNLYKEVDFESDAEKYEEELIKEDYDYEVENEGISFEITDDCEHVIKLLEKEKQRILKEN